MFDKPSLLLKENKQANWKGLEDLSKDHKTDKTSKRTTFWSTSWPCPLKVLPILHVFHYTSINQILTAVNLQEIFMSGGRFLIYLENNITEMSLY